MKIPQTKGYTVLVKIAECALNGDTDKARKYIKKYMIMYPDSDLIYPFTHLLAGELNPSGLGHHDIITDFSVKNVITDTSIGFKKETNKVKPSNSDGNYSPIAKKVWSYLKYTECDINGEHKTLIEATDVWDMINALEFHIHDELMRLENLSRVFEDKEATSEICDKCGNPYQRDDDELIHPYWCKKCVENFYGITGNK